MAMFYTSADIKASTWTPTMNLRLRTPDYCFANVGTYDGIVIEQEWRCLETGETYWKPIPHVTESEAKESK